MKLTIPIPEKVSLNKIYAGVHFRQRQEHKGEYDMAIMCTPGIKPWPGPYPVAMQYHFRLHGSPLDISNHAYMLKMVEDALVEAGVLPGDEPEYVGRITITAERIKQGFDEVVVEICTP